MLPWDSSCCPRVLSLTLTLPQACSLYLTFVTTRVAQEFDVTNGGGLYFTSAGKPVRLK